jgi:ketosteroid isomerase-like protein
MAQEERAILAQEERAICDLLDEFTRALYTKDSARAIAPLADDAVTFDLAPPPFAMDGSDKALVEAIKGHVIAHCRALCLKRC